MASNIEHFDDDMIPKCKYPPHEYEPSSDYAVLKFEERSYRVFHPMLNDTRTLEQKYGQFVEKLMKKSDNVFLSELTRFENYGEFELIINMFNTMFFEQIFIRCLELKVFETIFLEIRGELTHRRLNYLGYLVENKKCPDEFILKCMQVLPLRGMLMDMESFHISRPNCKSKCSYYTEKVRQKLVEFGFGVFNKYFGHYNKLKKIIEIICDRKI
jgi:hypothetical protein